jgi:hypothetical protein
MIPGKCYNVIEKWGQYIYVDRLNFRYSPFFGERVLYRINIRVDRS